MAEFLLGDFPITWLPLVLVLAPMYGGGALLVRELAHRLSAGWPGVFVLGLAFGVIEEAYTTQSLFNPNYLGLHLLAYGWVPQLGMGVPWTVFVLGLHTVWSVATSIALVEALFPTRAAARWLGSIGLAAVALVFVAGCILLTVAQLRRDPFVATPAQFVGAGVAVVLLVALAWSLRRVGRVGVTTGATPVPLSVGTAALAAGSLFMIDSRLGAHMPAWANVGLALALIAGMALLVRRWSRTPSWTSRHRFALMAGAVLTYTWWGFYQRTVVPTPIALDLTSNAVF